MNITITIYTNVADMVFASAFIGDADAEYSIAASRDEAGAVKVLCINPPSREGVRLYQMRRTHKLYAPICEALFAALGGA